MTNKVYVIVETYWGEHTVLNPVYTSEKAAEQAIEDKKKRDIVLGCPCDYTIDIYDLVGD